MKYAVTFDSDTREVVTDIESVAVTCDLSTGMLVRALEFYVSTCGADAARQVLGDLFMHLERHITKADEMAHTRTVVLPPTGTASDPMAGYQEWATPHNGIIWTVPGGRIMIQRVEPGDLTSAEARALAVALLAAAETAEQEKQP